MTTGVRDSPGLTFRPTRPCPVSEIPASSPSPSGAPSMPDFGRADALENDPEFNPYSAPKVDAAAMRPGHGTIWREGKLLVMSKGAELPARCVKCNGSDRSPT